MKSNNFKPMKDARESFYMPEGTYLNCSYMSPLLKDVEEAGIKAIRKRRQPATIQPEQFFTETDKIRQILAGMLNAEAERFVLVPSVSYGMAHVVHNLSPSPEQEILLAAEQFPSNFYPWQRLARRTGASLVTVAPDPGAASRGKNWNDKLLEAINEQTAVVGISNVHWADGTRFDLLRIRKRANEVGALLVIDGTQSVGALPFDISEIQPDALICAGYKWLMGPYSLGFAYYGPYFDQGIPVEENWINRKNSEDFKGLVRYQEEYQPGALRYEVGEHSNFTLVPMFHAALKKVAAWTPEKIQTWCRSLMDPYMDRIRGMGYLVDEEPWRAAHVFGIRLPESVNPELLKKAFEKENIIVSFRGDAIRISPNIYNTDDDISHLVSVLEKVASTSPVT